MKLYQKQSSKKISFAPWLIAEIRKMLIFFKSFSTLTAGADDEKELLKYS